MHRSITEKLIRWKNASQHKPLLLRGARQVGKTYSIRAFGEANFRGQVAEFNFEKNPELNEIFKLNLDVNRILSELEIFLGKRIIPGEDLLFFDEIQDCSNAILSLRYFFEDKADLHVIAAGSLLEFALKDIRSPVGRIQMMEMHPMTFKEFLIAGQKELLADSINNSSALSSETALSMINQEMYKYFIVGGMPECVSNYLSNGSFLEVINIQRDLLATYRQDFSKYAGHADKSCINAVLSSVAKVTGEQIKYSKLAEGFSNATIKKAFHLLETARLFTKVRAASPAGIPLETGASEKKFKSIFLDIGIMSCVNGFYSDISIGREGFQAALKGRMAEQFVGQELIANSDSDLYYWARDAKSSQAEVDFMIQKENRVIPIEVKSGKSGSLKSLHLLLSQYENVNTSYVFIEDKSGSLEGNRIQFLPLSFASTIV